MQEKRKILRRFLLYYMRVYDTTTRRQIGNLVDITSKGIMVVCEHPIPDGKSMRLKMELSNEVAEKPFMEFTAVSKWCEPDVSPSMFNVGFEIENMNIEDAEIIRRINEEFGFRDNTPEK